jgi:hypothetical protein
MKELEQLILSKSRPVQKEVKQLQKSELDRLIVEAFLGEQQQDAAALRQALENHINKELEAGTVGYIGDEAKIEPPKNGVIKILNFSKSYDARRGPKEKMLNDPSLKEFGLIDSGKNNPRGNTYKRTIRTTSPKFTLELKPSGKVGQVGNPATVMEEVLGYWISGKNKFKETYGDAMDTDPGYFGTGEKTYLKLYSNNNDFKEMVDEFQDANKPFVLTPTAAKKAGEETGYSPLYMEFVNKASPSFAGQVTSFSREGKTDIQIISKTPQSPYNISIKDAATATQLVGSQGGDAAFHIWFGVQASKPEMPSKEQLTNALLEDKAGDIKAIADLFSKRGYEEIGGNISVVNKILSRLTQLMSKPQELIEEAENTTIKLFNEQVNNITDDGKKRIIREAATGEFKFSDKKNVANWMLEFSETNPAFEPMDKVLDSLYKTNLDKLKIRVSRRGDKLRQRIDKAAYEDVQRAAAEVEKSAEQAATQIEKADELNEGLLDFLKKTFNTLVEKLKKLYERLKKFVKETVESFYNVFEEAFKSSDSFAESQELVNYELSFGN